MNWMFWEWSEEKTLGEVRCGWRQAEAGCSVRAWREDADVPAVSVLCSVLHAPKRGGLLCGAVV